VNINTSFRFMIIDLNEICHHHFAMKCLCWNDLLMFNGSSCVTRKHDYGSEISVSLTGINWDNKFCRRFCLNLHTLLFKKSHNKVKESQNHSFNSQKPLSFTKSKSRNCQLWLGVKCLTIEPLKTFPLYIFNEGLYLASQ
jgi:hypothetical protein